MKYKKNILTCFSTFLLTVSMLFQTSWAIELPEEIWNISSFEETLDKRHFAIKAAAGVGWLQAHEAYLHVTQYETDQITFKEGTGVVGSLGVAYVIPTNPSWDRWKWLSTLKLSLDLTQQFSTTLDGDVFLYGDHSFDNYESETRIESTNLIVNAALDILQYKDVYLFIMGGIGLARTNLTYDEDPNPDVFRGNLQLDTNTTYTAAFQGGGGVGYALTPNLDVTVTYLYTDLGDVRTADTGKTDDIPSPALQSAKINLRQQSVLLGLEYAF